MKITLMVKGGKMAGKEIPIRTNQFVIGRDETCQLRPTSNIVSKLHCAIVVGDDAVWLRDLKSTNGTFHNGAKVEDRVQLNHGDEIQVGPLHFVVNLPEKPVAAKPTTTQKPAATPAAAKSSPKRKAPLDDSAVFEWLSEDDETEDEANGVEQTSDPSIDMQQTMIDMSLLESETVPEIDRPAPGKPSSEANTTSAADKALGGRSLRKRV